MEVLAGHIMDCGFCAIDSKLNRELLKAFNQRGAWTDLFFWISLLVTWQRMYCDTGHYGRQEVEVQRRYVA